MSRLHGLIGTLAFVALLVGVVVIGQNNSLAAVLGAVGLAAGLALQSTIANLIAAGRVRSEGRVHVGTEITAPGPEGPYTGSVEEMGFWSLWIHGEDGRALPVTYTQLVTGNVLIGRKISCPPSS